ncbi:MAG: Rpn family recombination-promoting nuclease/putative transposase, partial [Azoarcus sp.]|nr:Rpn family recombination-promoting nuclease/putative transposase [Azoarcus sp.]
MQNFSKGYDLLPPSSDIVFKMLFGDERNTDILIAFLRAVLALPDDEFKEITLMNPFLANEYPDEKVSILDVKAKTHSGKRIDIEIQVKNHAAFSERIVCYTARMLTEQGGEGTHYRDICPVVSIVITYFRLIDNEHYHNRYRLYDSQTKSELTDLVEIHILEPLKLPRTKPIKDEKLRLWMKFLQAKNREEMDMLAKLDPDIKKTVVKLAVLSADEKARMIHDARVKAALD